VFKTLNIRNFTKSWPGFGSESGSEPNFRVTKTFFTEKTLLSERRVTIYGHFIVSIADGELLGGNIVGNLLGEPLFLVHAAMDGDGWEVLLHQQLREGDAALHRLHEYHNLIRKIS
jgi:hypothetical protein